MLFVTRAIKYINMKRSLITIFITIITKAVYCQLVADSTNFIFFSDTSRIICDNYDILKIDLDKDKLNDLFIVNYKWREQCSPTGTFYNYNDSKTIRIGLIGSNIKLAYDNHNCLEPIPMNISINQEISKEVFKIPYGILYRKSMLALKCGLVECNWSSSGLGYIGVQKIVPPDTNYYLIRIHIFNDFKCTQAISPSYNVTQVRQEYLEDNFDYCIKNYQLFLSFYTNANKVIQIFNIQGKMIDFVNTRENDTKASTGSIYN